MSRSYRKLKELRDIWANPQDYEPCPAEKNVLNDLERFLGTHQAYNGRIICGNHGVGKTFTARYLLSRRGLLNDQFYVNVNSFISDRLNKDGVSLALKRQIYKMVEELLITKRHLLVLDSCEVLGILDSDDFRTFVENIHNSIEKVILILPSELDPKIPTMTKYFPEILKEDNEILLANLETTEEISEQSFSLTTLIRKVVGRT